MGEEQILQPGHADWQALVGFEIAIIERQVERGAVEDGRLRTCSPRLASGEMDQPGVERIPTRGACKGEQLGNHKRTIFPGFMMFFGSSARLITRMNGNAEGCSASRKCILP